MINGSKMDLSIIILNYKSRELVRQCLAKIRELNLALAYEIIVVDNASSDGCLEMVEKNFPGVIAIQTGENQGYAAGNNLGIRAASGGYILILNPDIVVLPDSIEKMLRFMEEHPECGLCGPQLLNPDGTVQSSCRRFPSLLIPLCRRTALGKFPFARRKIQSYLMGDWDHKTTRTVDWMLGACLLARRSAMEQAGPLDERFFLYFEDVDWCRRFWQSGHKVYYLSDAKMIHYHRQLSADKKGLKSLASKTVRIHLASALKYFWKYRFKNAII